ncbi:MAG: ATP-binding cassette domain-containing protein [Paracoccaceae bacterium]
MIQAARRVAPALDIGDPAAPAQTPCTPGALTLDGVTCRRDDTGPALFAPLTLTVAPGETVALAGPSGVGKSTLLLTAAGALAPAAGRVLLGDTDVATCPTEALRAELVMLPQRHGLISGTVAENLRLAAPGATDDDLWAALEASALADTIRARGGLGLRLGARGAGLSGGEARRLVLARALLRRPAVLLLDEPTEGLDTATAARVMAGIRTALPASAILVAAHRDTEKKAATRVIELRHPDA